MYSRPKPQETEQDLLRLQAEFNRNKAENKIKLAATVVSEKKDEEEDVNEAVTTQDIEEQIANTFEAIPATSNLGQIVEKTVTNQALPQLNFSRKKGFPVAKRRDVNATSSQQGGSIFAQQFKRFKPEATTSAKTATTSNLPSQSFILTGKEKDSIHAENVAKIRNMSEEEIIEEREKLLATMDPAIVTFLKSRRAKLEASTNRNPSIQEQNEAAQDMDIEQIETPSEILNQANSDKWLNFGAVETTKLAWMRDVDLPKIDKDKSFEARFDFEGWLLPYTDEINEKNRILYHHGEEAGRPGYTLQELFQLSRSNVIQQKIIALNTIANILSLQSTGVYDKIIDLPLEQIFFVLRFCLDDNTPSVLNASIKAMRNLFYSKIDETCLDCLLSFGFPIQPVLAIDNEQEDDNTVNDQQLAETNLVKCLARTEILVRIRYIINTVRPSIETIVYCMDILTRLARDSQFIMTKVYNCENLVKSVITHFVPVTPNQNSKDYGLPLLQAIKFLRILATRSRKIATDLVEKYKVMDAILYYLSSEKYSANTNGLRLQTESLHLWSVFVHYNLAMDSFQISNPVLMELLNYHFKNTDLDISTTFVRQGHISALLILLGGCCKSIPLILPFTNLLQTCIVKWFRQFMLLSEFECGKLQIIASTFQLLAFLSRLTKIPDETNTLVLDLINSKGFDVVTRTIKNGSMLLNNYEPLKCSPNLKTVEAAAWYASEHVVPVIQTNSPIPFLSAMSNFVEASDDHRVKLAFLNHTNIKDYLDRLRRLEKYFLSNHWFSRVESNLLMNVLKVSVVVKSDLDTCPFYEVAVKCLSVFTNDQKQDIEYILANIIFSSSFYPSEVLMNNLSIEQRHDCLETSLNNLSEILVVYTQVLGLKVDISNFSTNLCLDHSVGNVIPIDWIYTPIIVLYSNQQQNKKNLNESQQVFIIRNCLRWILIYETYFPSLAAAINPTDRFCRIACVFLGSDNLFLISEIHNLLQLCLNNVIKKSEYEINFNKEIQGLSSFQDFYTQLLEQYQGVSYGDVLFGNFILVPLAQRHSTKWRKILWSEYLGVVEIFNVTVEQSVCAFNSFLEPVEEDMSLLKCYRRALVNDSIRKHSILYHIAKHHVEQFIAKKKNKH